MVVVEFGNSLAYRKPWCRKPWAGVTGGGVGIVSGDGLPTHGLERGVGVCGGLEPRLR